MADAALACRCGEVTGVLHDVPDAVASRVVCYCTDCQAFARRTGHEEVLDAHGGTDIVQLSPRHLEFRSGVDRLGCLRLTENGPFRWYARCCGTPIGNTPPGQLPFVGLLTSTLGDDASDATLGPVGRRIMAKEAVNGPVTGPAVHAGFPLGLILRLLPRIVFWRLRGDARRSPFFDPETGAPRAEPDPDPAG